MTEAARPEVLARLIDAAARGGLAGVPPLPRRAAELFGETGWLRLLVPAAGLSREVSHDLEERLVKAEDTWNRQVLDLLDRLTRVEAAAAGLDEANPAQLAYRGVLRDQIDVLARQVRAFSERDAREFLAEAGLLEEVAAEPVTAEADASSGALAGRLAALIASWAPPPGDGTGSWRAIVPDVTADRTGPAPDLLLQRSAESSPRVAVYLDEYEEHAAPLANHIASDAAARAAARAAGTVVFQLTPDDLAGPGAGAPYERDAQAAARNAYRVLGGDPAELEDLIWRGGAGLLRAFLADPSCDRWQRVAIAALAGILVRPGGWRARLDEDNFHDRVLAAVRAERLPVSGGHARTLARFLDGRGCPVTVIIDQRDSGASAPLGWWTGLTVLDDRLPVIRLSEAGHRRRWTSWLHWGNLLQFLNGPDGDGRQLAYSRLDEFDPGTLAAAAAPAAVSVHRAVAGLRSPASLAPLFSSAGPVPAPASASASAPAARLSPVQRAIAERAFDGPALVTGGPGTGKTTVALHRASHLARRRPGDGRDVLFATFNKYLASLARRRLGELAGPDALARVEVVTIDALAARVTAEAGPAARRHWLDHPHSSDLWRDVLRESVRLETIRATEQGPRYRHVVVDEVQDLSAEHLMLLRAMAAPGPDDLFLVGDPGQRIHADEAPAIDLEISVAGRTAQLTHPHRPACPPELRGLADWPEELREITRQVTDWLAVAPEGEELSIGIALPGRRQVSDVVGYLDRQGIVVSAIGADGPRLAESVHVGTLPRFKGLEYQRMFLAGLGSGAVLTGPLLRMASARARQSLVISWHGEPSGLLAR
ncbi:MAG TPA: UvrD-helicase domain-containing protein [Trebonia sp.]|nr:UvrD-helicase domain-containing protein [Trebonia sp.]